MSIKAIVVINNIREDSRPKTLVSSENRASIENFELIGLDL